MKSALGQAVSKLEIEEASPFTHSTFAMGRLLVEREISTTFLPAALNREASLVPTVPLPRTTWVSVTFSALFALMNFAKGEIQTSYLDTVQIIRAYLNIVKIDDKISL
jgi:hypothetical protein